MDNEFLQIAKPLIRVPTAPFHEHFAMGFVRSFVSQRTQIKSHYDKFGNCLLIYQQVPPKSVGDFLILTAHLDHPGMVWKKTLSPGRAHYEILGGVDLKSALATGVRIFDLKGSATQRGSQGSIVGTAAQPGARYPLVEIESSPRIDQGSGSFAMWDLPGFRLRGRTLSGRALDDLAGASVGLCVLDQLCKHQIPGRVGLLLTRAEEVGFVGMLAALEAGFLRRRALYINIECSSIKAGATQGAGPILRVGDRLWVFDPGICGGLVALAEEMTSSDDNFRYQRKLMDSGACEATPLMQSGLRTGAVALPLGNYHNSGPALQLAPEQIHLDDALMLVRLLIQLAQQGINPAQIRASSDLDTMLAERLDRYRTRLGPI